MYVWSIIVYNTTRKRTKTNIMYNYIIITILGTLVFGILSETDSQHVLSYIYNVL